MKAEAAEDARRWEAEQEAERKRKESMILTQEEKDKILQVLTILLSINPFYQVLMIGSSYKLDNC